MQCADATSPDALDAVQSLRSGTWLLWLVAAWCAPVPQWCRCALSAAQSAIQDVVQAIQMLLANCRGAVQGVQAAVQFPLEIGRAHV